MYWSLSLDIKKQEKKLETIKEMTFKNKEDMGIIYRNIVSKFDSYSIELRDLDASKEFIRLDTCEVLESNDPKNLIANFSSQKYFDIKWKEEIENYFEEKKASKN